MVDSYLMDSLPKVSTKWDSWLVAILDDSIGGSHVSGDTFGQSMKSGKQNTSASSTLMFVSPQPKLLFGYLPNEGNFDGLVMLKYDLIILQVFCLNSGNRKQYENN